MQYQVDIGQQHVQPPTETCGAILTQSVPTDSCCSRHVPVVIKNSVFLYPGRCLSSLSSLFAPMLMDMLPGLCRNLQQKPVSSVHLL